VYVNLSVCEVMVALSHSHHGGMDPLILRLCTKWR
jgi:hypothetical protein